MSGTYKEQVNILEKKLKEDLDIVERIDCLQDLANLLSETSDKNAAAFAKEALRLSKELNLLKKIGKSKRILVRCYTSLHQYNKALTYGKSAEKIFLNFPEEKLELAFAQYELGRLYYFLAEFNISRQKYLLGLANAEADGNEELYVKCCAVIVLCYYKQGDFVRAREYSNMGLEKSGNGTSSSHAFLYNAIGILYGVQKATEKALLYYQKALDIWNKQDMFYHTSNVYNNMGLLFREIGELDKSLQYAFNSLELFQKHGSLLNVALAYDNIGHTYVKMEDKEHAFMYLNKGLELRQELKEHRGVGGSYRSLAEAHLKLNFEKKKIYEYLGKAIDVLSDQDTKTLLECYQLYIETYVKDDNYEKAFEYQAKYIEIQNLVSAQDIREVEERQEFILKEIEIEQLHEQQRILENHNKELQEFAAKAGHDLKAPLATINMYSHLLKRKFDKQQYDKNDEYLQVIQLATENMFHLVDELIKYTLAGAKVIETHPMDLNKVLKIVLNNLSKEILSNDATIQYSKMPVVLATKSSMIQVFQNILSNAIKFRSKQPPNIEIKMEKAQKEGYTLISVKDNGIGIDKNDQEKVFGLFQQLSNELKGSGIGLATCKKLVDQLGGEIWLESEKNVGTTFLFTLKLGN